MSNYLIGSDVIGADVIAPQRPAAVVPVQQDIELTPEAVAFLKYSIAPSLVAALAGLLLAKKHRVLVALGAATVAGSVYPIVKGGDMRKVALIGAGISAASIGGSLAWKAHPVFGYLAAGLAARMAVHAVVPHTNFQAFMLRGRAPTAGV